MADVAVDQTRSLKWLTLLVSTYTRHRLKQRREFIAASHDKLDLAILTRISCTAPQKQVAVASSSVDQPSFERFTTGKVLSPEILMISRLLNHRPILSCKKMTIQNSH